MSKLADIAADVVTRLNAASLSEEFTATRAYMPVYELPGLQTLAVTVIGERATVEQQDRGQFLRQYQIRVVIQKKLDPQTLAEVDALEDLAEEIDDLLAGVQPDVDGAYWDQNDWTNPRNADHLETLRQFSSVLTITYYAIT